MKRNGKDRILAGITRISLNLIGSSYDFSMEARIFHATCLVSMVIVAINIPMNYLVGVPSLSLLMAALLFIVWFIYYYSRFQRKLNTSFFLFSLFVNVFVTLNYYQNSGINGPSLLIFLLSLFLIISVAPRIQARLWVPLNIVLVSVLLFLQYLHPQSVPDTYPHIKGRYIDFAYSYVAIALLIVLITFYIRNSYNRQRLALIKKAAELEDANETKNKLLSIVAHDLRAPLASIQTYLEMLTEYQLSADEKRNMEQDLLEKTRNTGQMLSNLLLWTANQMDGVTVRLEELQLSETLKPMMVMQSAIAAEKCIGIKNIIANYAWVIADANMLQLVIRNLLNNAIKFTNPGGQITLSSERREQNWRIQVMDTGIGIANNRKDTIFSIKSQSTYGTKNEKGPGLGLLLCKEFTEMQHGQIGFESAAGIGTTFFVSLKGCRFPESVISGNKPVDSSVD